jgi:hypothetical protein
MPHISSEPLAILSRTWDPDVRRIGTLVLFSGNPSRQVLQILEESQFTKFDSTDDPPMSFFTRF